MRSLLLLPDTLTTPMGGMGVQLRGLLDGARADNLPLRFSIVGSGGEASEGDNYRYVPSHAHPIMVLPPHLSRWGVGFSQADYVDTGLWLYRWPEIARRLAIVYESVLR